MKQLHVVSEVMAPESARTHASTQAETDATAQATASKRASFVRDLRTNHVVVAQNTEAHAAESCDDGAHSSSNSIDFNATAT